MNFASGKLEGQLVVETLLDGNSKSYTLKWPILKWLKRPKRLGKEVALVYEGKGKWTGEGLVLTCSMIAKT